MSEKTIILLVEDENALRRLAQRMLEMDGYQVVATADGREALAGQAATPPRLIISDYKLPDMTGEELIRALRAVQPGVPVILTSGFGSEVAASANAGGPIHFLPKPFSRETLREKVHAALGVAG